VNDCTGPPSRSPSPSFALPKTTSSLLLTSARISSSQRAFPHALHGFSNFLDGSTAKSFHGHPAILSSASVTNSQCRALWVAKVQIPRRFPRHWYGVVNNGPVNKHLDTKPPITVKGQSGFSIRALWSHGNSKTQSESSLDSRT